MLLIFSCGVVLGVCVGFGVRAVGVILLRPVVGLLALLTGAKPRSFNVVHRHQGPNQITVLFIKALLGNFESSVKMMKSGTRVFSDLASPLPPPEVGAVAMAAYSSDGGIGERNGAVARARRVRHRRGRDGAELPM